MAGVKISALPAVISAALTDFFPVVQGGITSRETLQQVLTLFNANIQITEAQVTNLVADLASKLDLAGGTMTGNIDMNGNKVTGGASPTAPSDYTTKTYVDSLIQNLHLPAYAATTTNLTGYVYDNNGTGIGATLTAPGVGAFSTDGTSPPINSRILVSFQTAALENGIYDLTTVGDGATAAVLTRSTDYDETSEIQQGDRFTVLNGTLYQGTEWYESASTPIVIGVDPINFEQIPSAGGGSYYQTLTYFGG